MAFAPSYRGRMRADPVPASTAWTSAVRFYSKGDPEIAANLIKEIEADPDLVLNDLYAFDPLKGHYPVLHRDMEWSLNYIKPVCFGYPVPDGTNPLCIFRAKDHLLYLEGLDKYGEDFWLISHHMGRGAEGQWSIAAYACKLHYLSGIQVVADHVIEATRMGYSKSYIRTIVARLYEWSSSTKFVEKLLPVAKVALEIEANGGVVPDHLRIPEDDEEEKEEVENRKRKRGKKPKKKKQGKKKGKGKGRRERRAASAATALIDEEAEAAADDSSDDDGTASVVDNPMAGKKISLFHGVSWRKDEGKWIAQISVKGKQKKLGCFASEEEAAKAYDKAARERDGERALTNYDLDGERIDHEAALRADPNRTTSIYNGVTKINGLWVPFINHKGQCIKLHRGLKDEVEAAKLYDQHARKLHKKRAKPNFDLEGNRFTYKKQFARGATHNGKHRGYKPAAAAASSSSSSGDVAAASASSSHDGQGETGGDDDNEWEDVEEQEWEDMEN